MNKYKASAFFSILTLILFLSPYSALADQQWHYQAAAEVGQPGLIETVLPAGVFFGMDSQRPATGTRARRAHSVKPNLSGSYHTEGRKYIVVW